jgi:mono/diheme cytochrome c family protein
MVRAWLAGASLVVLSTVSACGGASQTPGTSGVAMPGYGPGGMMGHPRGGMVMGGMMRRHHAAMSGGLPAAYRGLRDPFPGDPKAIAAGKTVYLANCAVCHGDHGAGDGPAAAGMSPPPADLRWVMRRPMATDGYLMWTISEGGGALGTGMPAFGSTLAEADRWRVITYLRTL